MFAPVFCCNFAGMKLHIFNPEHDIALAFGEANFTSPRAGRQLRNDLGFLPAIWAEDGDCVVVDDKEQALSGLKCLDGNIADVRLVTLEELRALAGEEKIDGIEPWGWDAAIRSQLLRHGIPHEMLPTDCQINSIRELSNRRWAATYLDNKGVYCDSEEMLVAVLANIPQCVLKAPWSSSGRGVRYKVDMAWARNVIRSQGGIMVEPYYNKVADFGMEFLALSDGSIQYVGLSVFDTNNGAYTGNVIAEEEQKRELLAKYVPKEELDEARMHVMDCMRERLKGVYVGPFGVDMMIYRDGDGHNMLNHCVELNLRRTMGHAAITLAERMNIKDETKKDTPRMRIYYNEGKYRISITEQ